MISRSEGDMDESHESYHGATQAVAFAPNGAGPNVGAGRSHRIGPYEILDEAAVDGQGRWLRVRHPQLTTQCLLAIAEQAIDDDSTALEQLRRQRRLLRGCIHPNLVKILDLDCHDGRPFVVIEDLRGLSLSQYARERMPDPREAAGIVIELASAVSYLHDRGLEQPDIRPADVVIDETGRARLSAFGLAGLDFGDIGEAQHEDANGARTTTVPGAQPTTCACAAGVPGLGRVLYHLLTWRPAPVCNTTRPGSREIAAAALVPPRQVNQRVPRALERICLKAMAPAGDRRYREASDLERALRRFLARRWIGVAAVGLVLLLGLVFLRS